MLFTTLGFQLSAARAILKVLHVGFWTDFVLALAALERDPMIVVGRRKARTPVSISPPSPPGCALRLTTQFLTRPAIIAGFVVSGITKSPLNSGAPPCAAGVAIGVVRTRERAEVIRRTRCASRLEALNQGERTARNRLG